MRPLWLASSSPRRKKMLLEAGLPRLAPGSLDDDLLRFKWASVPSICLARAWFMALGTPEAPRIRITRSRGPGALLAADTLCELAGAPLGKPRNEADALEMLHSLCGARHRTITAVALLDRATMDRSLWFDAAEVTIGTIPETELRRYVATDGWRGSQAATISRTGFRWLAGHLRRRSRDRDGSPGAQAGSRGRATPGSEPEHVIAAIDMSPYASIGIGGLLIGLCAWYWQHLGKVGTSPARRSIRRGSLVIAVLAVFALVRPLPSSIPRCIPPTTSIHGSRPSDCSSSSWF